MQEALKSDRLGPNQLSKPFRRNQMIASWADSSTVRDYSARSFWLSAASKCMLRRVSFTPVMVAIGIRPVR